LIKKRHVAHLLDKGSLSIHVSDGKKGFPNETYYDVIHVGVTTSKVLESLVYQPYPGEIKLFQWLTP
jgi:protein-L-isoaspartate(D-aspartate) O-methyltransferase